MFGCRQASPVRALRVFPKQLLNIVLHILKHLIFIPKVVAYKRLKSSESLHNNVSVFQNTVRWWSYRVDSKPVKALHRRLSSSRQCRTYRSTALWSTCAPRVTLGLAAMYMAGNVVVVFMFYPISLNEWEEKAYLSASRWKEQLGVR